MKPYKILFCIVCAIVVNLFFVPSFNLVFYLALINFMYFYFHVLFSYINLHDKTIKHLYITKNINQSIPTILIPCLLCVFEFTLNLSINNFSVIFDFGTFLLTWYILSIMGTSINFVKNLKFLKNQ